ncbi:fimbrial protein pilin [Pseudomonas sp. BAY1663]|uniref:Prepilin-type cleavage/methylation domain-containing protein n=1 Tax=Stutzerimonas stutzeri TaxID=316 RepID=A0A2N8T6B3_STUST|nr:MULTISPECIES: type II secretion system protein [Pseudomonadaceae]EXF45535.1 fimbrial protein pilin [Pseudomonas sp. BAY1663]MCQ4325549.1 type II secretion system GspH family protein [Stutzerimonas stutzeri]PNG10232.1 prepilin-type cleavage/methylation domain-containing protein [Stutzerimonas stutzeri]
MIKQRGFTIVELIMVIVILGIISAVAVPRFFDRKVFDERFYFEEILSAVRYAQKLAVASGCPVRFVLDGNGYALSYRGSDCTSVIAEDYPKKIPSGITLNNGLDITFNSLGCLVVDIATPSICSTSGTDTADVGGHVFTVHAATGFIEVGQ